MKRSQVIATFLILVVSVSGVFAQPIITVRPDSLYFRVTKGDTASGGFVIGNAGSDTLRFHVLNASLWSSPGEDCSHHCLGAFYCCITSDDPGGPQFTWVDIRSIGTHVPLGDDTNVGPFPLGFAFDFYDRVYSSVRICSNGFLSFTSTSTAFANQCIPSLPEPNNALYVFWDDLDLRTRGSVHYYRDPINSRFIVQFTDVPRYPSTEPDSLTFQVILSPNGEILFQYLRMVGTLGSATIGIEDSTGTTGLSLACNGQYVSNEFAVLFKRLSLSWLFVDRANGTIVPGDSAVINLIVVAWALPPGNYFARLRVVGNTPQYVDVPIHLEVLDPTDVQENPSLIPRQFVLYQNYPNPFNPSTTIRFEVPRTTFVVLKVYNLLGREVATLVNETLSPATYERIFNAEGLPSGVFFCRLSAGGFVQTKKLLLLR